MNLRKARRRTSAVVDAIAGRRGSHAGPVAVAALIGIVVGTAATSLAARYRRAGPEAPRTIAGVSAGQHDRDPVDALLENTGGGPRPARTDIFGAFH